MLQYTQDSVAFGKRLNAQVATHCSLSKKAFAARLAAQYYKEPRIVCEQLGLTEDSDLAFIEPYAVGWSGRYHCTNTKAHSDPEDDTDENPTCRICHHKYLASDFATFKHKEFLDTLLEFDSGKLAPQLKYCPGDLLLALCGCFRIIICTQCGGLKRMGRGQGESRAPVTIGECSFVMVPKSLVRTIKYQQFYAKHVKTRQAMLVTSDEEEYANQPKAS